MKLSGYWISFFPPESLKALGRHLLAQKTLNLFPLGAPLAAYFSSEDLILLSSFPQKFVHCLNMDSQELGKLLSGENLIHFLGSVPLRTIPLEQV